MQIFNRTAGLSSGCHNLQLLALNSKILHPPWQLCWWQRCWWSAAWIGSKEQSRWATIWARLRPMERSWEDQTPGGHRTGRDPQTKGTGSDQRDQSGNRDTKNANFHKSHSVIRDKTPTPISLATTSRVNRRSIPAGLTNSMGSAMAPRAWRSSFTDPRTPWKSKKSPHVGVDPNLRSSRGMNTKRHGLKHPKYVKHK